MQGTSVQAEKQKSSAPQPAPTVAPTGSIHDQLKQSSYAEGDALLTPVQAKGGITIGAHKGGAQGGSDKGPGGKPAGGKGPSGITIGAHKGPGAPGKGPAGGDKGPAGGGKGPSGITIGAHKAPMAPGGAAQPGVASAPPGVAAPVGAAPGGAAQPGGAYAPGGIVIGAHKTPMAGQAPGQAMPVVVPPGGAGAQPAGAPGGAMVAGPVAGPPQKPLPPTPGKPGGPPQKPPPPTPGKAGGPPQKPPPPIPGGAGAAGPAAAPGMAMPVVPGMMPGAPGTMPGGMPGQVAPGAPGMAAPVVLPPGAMPGAGPVVAPPKDPEDEDRESFFDVDGNIGLFDDESKVTRYFHTKVPNDWVSAHPMDHWAIHERCTKELGMTDHELFSLIGYTGPGYAPMNRLTRGEMKSKRFATIFKPYTAAATVALGKLNNKKDKDTQRGWRKIKNGDPGVIEGIYKREFVDEKGFMSTTANSDKGFFAGPVSIQIKGKSGVDIQQLSVLPSEGEILYPPNTRFKVKRFQRNQDVESAWKAWHNDETMNPKPPTPWFEVDLEEQ